MFPSSFLFVFVFCIVLHEKAECGLAKGLVNVQTLTMFEYSGKQIYIYSMIADVNQTECRKWKFYYVPVMQPIRRSNGDWVWTEGREVRMRLIIGDGFVEAAARRAIQRKYDEKIVAECSKNWDVSPLIIEILIGSVVKSSNAAIEGVSPFQLINPNTMVVNFRFECRTREIAENVTKNLIDGSHEIEIAFHFDGFKQVKSNMISINGERLKSIFTGTISDGHTTKARFVHRNQAKQFVNSYSTNVKRTIYIEDQKQDVSASINNLQDQFNALFLQGIQNSEEIRLKIEDYNKIWQSSDFYPEILTHDINRVFILNKTAVRGTSGETLYNVNQDAAAALIKSSTDILKNAWRMLVGASSHEEYIENKQRGDALPEKLMTSSEIENFLSQQAIHVKCDGQRLKPTEIIVAPLAEIVDQMQVAIIEKQMTAEKIQGAVMRTVSALNEPTISQNGPVRRQFRVQFGKNPSESENWTHCNCTAVIPSIAQSRSTN